MNWKQDIVILKEDGWYTAFPTLEQLADGRLVVNASQRDRPSHSSDPRARVMVSEDGGESWAETGDRTLKPLWPGASGKFRIVPADGTWLDMGAGGHQGSFDAPELRPAAERDAWEAKGYATTDHEVDGGMFYLSGRQLHVGRSRDEGAHWSHEAFDAPADMVDLNAFRGMRLGDGTLLCPVGGRVRAAGMDLRAYGGAPWREYMVRSTDGGATWEWTAMYEDSRGGYTEEVTLLEVASGRVLALIRAHRPGPTGYLWQQWSDDGGRTWGEPVETRIWGFPAHLLMLQDGRALCTYGYRREPMGIRAAVSDDLGISWNVEDELVLRDDGGTPAKDWGAKHIEAFIADDHLGQPDLGYPYTAQNADGSLVTVYYITEADGITHAAATRWALDGAMSV
ncbi:MAG: hypothetical protein CMJ49_04810 [Planctomycetaceae bacterium]|nr:hypothetical protein [Planctomycetaceae bacterium]